MSQATKSSSLTADEARRLGGKYRLVEAGIWSAETARQWLTRQFLARHFEERAHEINKPKRSRDDCAAALSIAPVKRTSFDAC